MRAVVILVAWLVSTSLAQAVCGEKDGPGYRKPNGQCASWMELARACGSPPEQRCTPEKVNPKAGESADHGLKALKASPKFKPQQTAPRPDHQE
jgi:hypothetical protein